MLVTNVRLSNAGSEVAGELGETVNVTLSVDAAPALGGAASSMLPHVMARLAVPAAGLVVVRTKPVLPGVVPVLGLRADAVTAASTEVGANGDPLLSNVYCVNTAPCAE